MKFLLLDLAPYVWPFESLRKSQGIMAGKISIISAQVFSNKPGRCGPVTIEPCCGQMGSSLEDNPLEVTVDHHHRDVTVPVSLTVGPCIDLAGMRLSRYHLQ